MYTNGLFPSFDVSTRPKRKKAIMFIISLLVQIKDAEDAYLLYFNFNRQNNSDFSDAEHRIDAIDLTIANLGDAYLVTSL
jgi:hypothetical protein